MKNTIAIIKEPLKIELVTQDLRQANDDEAIIEVKSSSICGSDLHLYKGKHPSVKLPSTVGHEFSGDIISIGKDNNGFKVGDRVVLEPIINCGECEQCKSGNYGLCENATFNYRVGDGAFAKYVVGKTSHLFKLNDNISYDKGALIEPLSVSSRAVKRSEVKKQDKVLVYGAGTIGLFIVAILKQKGVEDITVVDYADKRLNAAIDLGAKYSINPKDKDIKEELAKIHKDGFNVAFECIGKQETFNTCLQILKTDGLLLQVGIFENPNVNFDISRIITKQITIRGTQGYNNDFIDSIKLIEKLDIDKLITHVYSLDEINEAFDCALNASKTDALKVIVHP